MTNRSRKARHARKLGKTPTLRSQPDESQETLPAPAPAQDARSRATVIYHATHAASPYTTVSMMDFLIMKAGLTY